MKKMNPQMLRFFWPGLIALFLMIGGSVSAQQIPVSGFYVYKPSLYNPATMGTSEFNRFFLIHQQRRTFFKTLSNSQMLTFNSAHMNGNDNIGWGVFVTSDFEFVERRINANFALSYHLINRKKMTPKDDPFGERLLSEFRLSMGAMGGMSNWTLDFSKIPVYDRSETEISRQSVTRPDLGFGLDGLWSTPMLKVEIGGAATQLPEWLLKEGATDTLVSMPHIFAHGSVLYNVGDSIFVGPAVYYRNFFGDGRNIINAMLDMMVKTEFRKHNIWVGSGYRMGNAAISAAGGLEFAKKDSSKKGRYLPQSWEIAAGFELPINGTVRYGPTFELGVAYNFGQIKQVEYDTIEVYTGPFWANTGNLNEFMEENLGEEAEVPENLFAISDYGDNHITLSFEFDDNSFIADPTKSKGVMNLLDHLANDLLYEAYHPSDERDLDYPDYISAIESIEFSCQMRDDDIGLGFLADTDEYTGEVIEEEIYYNEEVRNFRLEPGRLTNLQLAYLKLYNMRKTFERMLENRYTEEDDPQLKHPNIDLINIETNYYNLESWQKNIVTIRFKKGYRRKLRSSN